MKVDYVREPKPPIKEVILTMSLEEFDQLRRLTFYTTTVPTAISKETDLPQSGVDAQAIMRAINLLPSPR